MKAATHQSTIASLAAEMHNTEGNRAKQNGHERGHTTDGAKDEGEVLHHNERNAIQGLLKHRRQFPMRRDAHEV